MKARILAALGVMALLLAGGAAYLAVRGGGPPAAGALDIGGPFTLAAARGGQVSSAQLAGRPYAVFFGFTHCPEVCPTTLSDMGAALETLGPAAKDVRVFFITVDPERDTLGVMKDYIANFDPRIDALVPSPEQLAQLARDFRIYYAKVPSAGGGYTMDHTASVFLMGADGRFFGTIAYGEAPAMRAAKLRRLVAAR